jgi:uncharacterized protein YgbK (DUF1537 family)
MIVGAPALRRYVLFGNLFATVDGETHRIDRHPTMSRHPVTPMGEADLRQHLSQQTTLSSANIDILALQAAKGLERLETLRAEGKAIVLFDTLDAPSLREAGRAIWESRPSPPSFLAGSSGIEYALLAYWDLPAKPKPAPPPPVDRLLVVSGSCSPVTAGQIHWALQNGFTGVPLDPVAMLDGEAEFERAVTTADAILRTGGSPVVYSAAGPADVVSGHDLGQRLGIRLGALANQLLRRHELRRALIAGGDTSGHAGHALSIQALTLLQPFAPGSPLCRIWSHDPAMDGREIMLKGGQVGAKTLFVEVKG